MISTGKAGRAVAVVFGGAHDGVVVKIASETDAPEVPKRPMHEVLDEQDFLLSLGKVKKLTLLQQLKIEMAMEAAGELEDDEEDEDEKAPTGAIGRRVMATYRTKSRSEYRLDDGKMIVLPSREPERVFVAGKSGAGKSFFTASYMREYSEMFPNRRIFLFSTHSEEKAYSSIEHEAIPLDEQFIQNPPTLEQLGGSLDDEGGPAGSLCVFDDCDNLQDKRFMQKAVDAVNADLISNGRKYNIHVVSLNHQLMEHSRTRNQLNEANRVVFFPQGSPYHNQRYLKVYAGLDGKWVKKILEERSRWICLDLRVPISYVTENAVVIIKNDAQAL